MVLIFAAAVLPGIAEAEAIAVKAVLVEAEGFDDYGGWVLDQQFMDQMGSPFLLAHGLGEPVDEATTIVEFPEIGQYRVWVRSRDWVAPWAVPGAPGRFQVFIDTRLIEKEFGAEGDHWHWQDGGTVEIRRKNSTIGLRDLTGFEGRCDAIVFSRENGFVPPNEEPALSAFRRKILNLKDVAEEAGPYDLIVVGGGIAGICTSVSAARLGLQVALIQDRPVLGGNNSSEVRVWLGGETNKPPYPRIGGLVKELQPRKRAHYGPENTADKYEDDKRIALLKSEKNISLFLNHRVNKVETDSNIIKAVIAQNIRTSRTVRFTGSLLADCTGDGCVGFLAGADYDMTTTGHMGRSNLWNVIDTGKPVSFPRCPWAVNLEGKPFPGSGNNPGTHSIKGLLALGGWYWESGFFYHPFKKGEYIRDLNLRAMYGAWDVLKNVEKQYPNHKIAWAAYISGKRESRRLLGDVILTKADCVTGRIYPDGCVPATWTIDLHLPDPQYDLFGDDAFISKAYHTKYKRPYWIPYRCFYSRNISNLFMAGRDISVTHEALGTVRVMRTTGMMGEIVGMAASLCKKHNTNPRGVYQNHLGELQQLMQEGVGKPVKVEINTEKLTLTGLRCSGQYELVKIPGSLLGLDYVTIARGDYTTEAPGYSFEVEQDVFVFLAIHDRGNPQLPGDWKKTDDKITWKTGDLTFTDTVYVKRFPKGLINIPGHNGKDGSYYGIPNMAIIKPCFAGGKTGRLK